MEDNNEPDHDITVGTYYKTHRLETPVTMETIEHFQFRYFAATAITVSEYE